MKIKKSNLLSAILICCYMGSAVAEDLGVYGNLYPISEKNLITVIKDKAAKFIADGGEQRLIDDGLASFKKLITDPEPVPGITKAVDAKTYYFIPEIVVEDGIYYPDGTEIVKPGTRVNYFDTQDFDLKLAIIDAREDGQVEWAKKILSGVGDTPVEVILTAGSTYLTSGKLKKFVYLDMGGQVTRHLGIKSVPALVTQDPENKRIRIDEVPTQ